MAAEYMTEPLARLDEDGTVVQPGEGGQLTATETPAPPPPMPEAGTPVTPTPPPAMPTPDPAPVPAAPTPDQATPPAAGAASAGPVEPQKPTTMAAPAEKADGWQVDTYRLRDFGDAVMRARSYLDTVQAKVDRMQGSELTPQLGTSPVGTQLAKKFDDRLNSADGLRAMLVEAMKRMDDFVTSAEEAARAYEELEENTVDTFDHHNESRPAKHGHSGG